MGKTRHFKQIISNKFLIIRYNPVGGGSYLPLPGFITKKNSTINVENRKDHLCLVWCILAHIHRRDGWKHKNPSRLSHYEKYVEDVKMSGVQVPTPASGIYINNISGVLFSTEDDRTTNTID